MTDTLQAMRNEPQSLRLSGNSNQGIEPISGYVRLNQGALWSLMPHVNNFHHHTMLHNGIRDVWECMECPLWIEANSMHDMFAAMAKTPPYGNWPPGFADLPTR